MIEIKTAHELAKMRRAGQIAAKALVAGGGAVVPGATTLDIERIVREEIIKSGARPSFLGYGGFPAACCISVNDEVIHGIPGRRTLREGDIVSIDVGAETDGFHGDTAGSFGCGKICRRAGELIEAAELALKNGISQAVAGNRIGDISFAVQNTVERLGFSVVREYVGHGIGRNLHEKPEVPNFGRKGYGVRLVPGMTIAIEPMINAGDFEVKVLPDGWTVKTKDGSLSAHAEHTIAVTTREPLILTSAT
jgi:methionyl aminopeptidase